MRTNREKTIARIRIFSQPREIERALRRHQTLLPLDYMWVNGRQQRLVLMLKPKPFWKRGHGGARCKGRKTSRGNFNHPTKESCMGKLLRATWAGLTSYYADRRYPFFRMGLESLFGGDDTAEIGYKLAQRIAFFLADNPTDARELFKKVKTCYCMRSKIIHGRWQSDPKIDAVMADTEGIVRTVLRRLLENPEMLRTFISKSRN